MPCHIKSSVEIDFNGSSNEAIIIQSTQGRLLQVLWLADEANRDTEETSHET